MRKQYYFRPSNRGLLAWDVDRLVEHSRHLPRKHVPLGDLQELDEAWWAEDQTSCRTDAPESHGDRTKVLVFGNSGSGKSTYARALATREGIPHLDLDTIVWEPNQIAELRPASAIRASLEAFITANPTWVIEGCYGDLVEAAASRATELVFLNPGLEACLTNNARRPWEPHKYGSPEQQDAMLANLQTWVAGYYQRADQWSYEAHRRIFDAHRGRKTEYTST